VLWIVLSPAIWVLTVAAFVMLGLALAPGTGAPDGLGFWFGALGGIVGLIPAGFAVVFGTRLLLNKEKGSGVDFTD
jgi:hypothetical protein